MNQAQAIFTPSGGTRRGACPSLDVPMRTGDGLLARVRLAGSRLTPRQLENLAELAGAHGNGMVEITARGNFQVRGLTSASAPRFASAVAADFSIETGLVIDTSPIAGDDPAEKSDAGPLVAEIRRGAADMAHQLGPKVSVVVDSGGQIALDALKADIRLVARDRTQWAVSLGGGKPQIMDADGAVAATLAVLSALAALGPEARAADLFPRSQNEPVRPETEPHTFDLTTGYTIAIALPFGQADASALIALAKSAGAAGAGLLRLAPGHRLLIDNAPAGLIEDAHRLGFITAATDPLLRVSACIGSEGCASGHIPARRIAGHLAARLPEGQSLHVSGCAKGCAHPAPADITLVGRGGGIGLVRNGRAGDTPEQVLDADDLSALSALREAR